METCRGRWTGGFGVAPASLGQGLGGSAAEAAASDPGPVPEGRVRAGPGHRQGRGLLAAPTGVEACPPRTPHTHQTPSPPTHRTARQGHVHHLPSPRRTHHTHTPSRTAPVTHPTSHPPLAPLTSHAPLARAPHLHTTRQSCTSHPTSTHHTTQAHAPHRHTPVTPLTSQAHHTRTAPLTPQ